MQPASVLWAWLFHEYHWPKDFTLKHKLMLGDVMSTLLSWGIAVLSVIGGAIAATRKFFVGGRAAAVVFWLTVSIVLTLTTPYVPKTCFQDIAGGYSCDTRDLVFKFPVMLVSLGYLAIPGLVIGTRFSRKRYRPLIR
ncbi:hypothetical protein [Roseibium sp.]|uniref:hypothetical protein n=2 Tax=Roseibium sp. TaxID=1936156 RepID=UPI003D1002B6